MKKFAYILLVAVCSIFIVGCRGKGKVEVEKTTNSTDKKNEPKTERIISNALLNELNGFIHYNDSLKKQGGYTDTNIFLVDFYTNNDQCYVSIMENTYYISHKMDGYIILKGNLITFSNVEGCGSSLVCFDKLHKGKANGFPDDESDIALKIYDPIGKRYRIHSKDSLELIFFGFL